MLMAQMAPEVMIAPSHKKDPALKRTTAPGKTPLGLMRGSETSPVANIILVLVLPTTQDSR
ncbi:uncharacterized protein PGTG_03842 [Puccinia graminis f. sp. tritici CRL 75-36-700-3]|uniref:Uncharacterized protein n=1 Tax=Puccinia graminis f. sp. tritici (strain CRL 75-36-700-3 / race SCCL) TaxID=418459 RepID=E3K0R1_PUCGT|nr:uncharacterized protein PGTG_03842 [Puccinia graminis f. sp. tritici CRL 75-36-700-3]EFP77886.2 hypothetical protein PGTG_03842 [Puccinia graminis f. sp. tritici CRL 75-36-700-3]